MLLNDRPGSVRLLTGVTGGHLRSAVYEYGLAVRSTAKSVRIVKILADVETAVSAGARIAPFVSAVRISPIESVVIGAIGVTAVFAIQILRKRRADGAAHDHAGNGGRRPSFASNTTQNSADQSARNDARWIG